MIDPGTGMTLLGAGVGSAKLVEKVLGPTAEYLGDGLKSWTAKRFDNVRHIFEYAERAIGDNADASASVPPRVLRDVLNDGSFRDDELSAAYYGGILASSKTGISRDDRGASFTALVGRLTSYQLRAHFVFYSVVRQIYVGQDHNLQDSTGRRSCRTFLPVPEFARAMAFSQGEDFSTILAHTMFGLQKESLIEDQFRYGPPEALKGEYKNATTYGIVFMPSALGIELFLWATGNSKRMINKLLDPSLAIDDLGVPSCPSACHT